MLLLQVPPAVASVRVIVDDSHTALLPPIAAGSGLTVAVAVTIQPDGNVYEIVALPAVPPVTTPDGLTDATPALLLDHTPPLVLWLRLVVEPEHTLSVPPIPAGVGNTVIPNVL